MRIAIYGSRHQDEFIGGIVDLMKAAVSRGDTLIVHRKLYDYLRAEAASEFKSMASQCEAVDNQDFDADIVVSVGGDGTFLRTAQWVGDKEIPIIGVNTGHLGFLAPFSLAEAAQALASGCVASTYNIIDRSVLCLDIPGMDVETWPFALNEVAVLKRDTASMVSIDVRVDNAPLADYLCDGLIISTPTGSTGYNLSVGGPIVQPGSPSTILSPIAAHSLSMRPLVIDSGSLIELKVYSRSSTFRVSLDGRSVSLPCGQSVYVSRAPFVIRTVLKPGHNFFATIREKLLWGVSASENKLKN